MSKSLVAFEPSDDTTFVPIVSAEVAQKHHTLVASDDRYRAALRLLAALWREDEGQPVGQFVGRDGARRKLGSRLSDKAGRAGRNFMSPAVAQLAQHELIYRQVGALYDATRLRTNLLASQALCFNLFGPAKLDQVFAGQMMENLLPGTFREVSAVYFEFSPGRGDPLHSGDFTAVDVMIEGIGPVGERTFVAVEVKYAEGCNDTVPRSFNPRHVQIAADTAIVSNPGDPALLANPLQQLFREHMLSQSMIDREQFDTGTFIVIAPAANRQVHAACASYEAQLADPADRKVAFASITLEQVIEATAGSRQEAYAQKLHRRYCDFSRIERAIA